MFGSRTCTRLQFTKIEELRGILSKARDMLHDFRMGNHKISMEMENYRIDQLLLDATIAVNEAEKQLSKSDQALSRVYREIFPSK